MKLADQFSTRLAARKGSNSFRMVTANSGMQQSRVLRVSNRAASTPRRGEGIKLNMKGCSLAVGWSWPPRLGSGPPHSLAAGRMVAKVNGCSLDCKREG
ncbi:hypothetical protein D9M68_854960 [compost metagenome]